MGPRDAYLKLLSHYEHPHDSWSIWDWGIPSKITHSRNLFLIQDDISWQIPWKSPCFPSLLQPDISLKPIRPSLRQRFPFWGAKCSTTGKIWDGHVYKWVTGWWFQTFFIFNNIWDNPSHWLIFFKGVDTTNQVTFHCQIKWLEGNLTSVYFSIGFQGPSTEMIQLFQAFQKDEKKHAI